MKYCNYDDLYILSNNAQSYYPNSICFNDKKHINLLGNYHDS